MTNNNLRLAFAGTPELARIVLESIIKANLHKIEIVFTQPDRPAGRGRELKQSEVKQYALEHSLPIVQPTSSKELDPNQLQDCDIMLVVAYGLLIPAQILNKPKLGCINIHTSLLPRWRGAAPIQRAIEAGDKETGISIMQMDTGLDTGPIIEQLRCSIYEDDTGGKLHDRLAQIAAEEINSILSKIASQKIKTIKQDDALATYANKISKQEGELDWQLPAIELERKIRAFNPYPVTFKNINSTKIRIWDAVAKLQEHSLKPGTTIIDNSNLDIATANGMLSIKQIQLPGKKVIATKDFLNGHPNFFN